MVSYTIQKKGKIMNRSRRSFLKAVGLMGLSGTMAAKAWGAAAGLAGRRPNIVMIMPDDVSYGGWSCYGGSLKTPHVDDLYKRGLRLESFHVSPTCSPTRASLLTGRQEFYSGVTHTIVLRDRMSLKSKTVADVLSGAGYTTGIFGKWHLGDEAAYRPDARGFQETYIHGAGGIGQNYPHSADFPGNKYNDPVLYHNGTPVKTKGYCTNLFFDQAMKWIGEQKKAGKTFFAYIPTNVVHGPQQPPLAEYVLTDGSETEGKTGILKNFDLNVGPMMKFLETNGLLENTLVVFLCDNGSSSGNKNLKGGKGSAYEGGIRVPCFFYWKGRIEGGVECDRLTGHIDMFMTFTELAGAKVSPPGDKPWDGRSLLPLLEDPKAAWPKRYIVGHRSRWSGGGSEKSKYAMSSIQDETFKLVNNKELYNLIEDLSEKNDIAAKNPEKVKELQEVYERFWQDVQPFLVNEGAAAERPSVKPYHELYRKQFGEPPQNPAEPRKKPRKKKQPTTPD